MNTRILNLTDDHRRLHLQHSEVEPTVVCVLLFVQDRPVAGAHADFKQCRFSVSSDGPLFWVGKGTNFLITEQERREIEEFLRTPREQMNCGRCPLDARDPDHDCAAPDCLDDQPLLNAETMFSGRMNQA